MTLSAKFAISNRVMRNQSYTHYPFSAIVGQEALKTALLLTAVDPGLGGVLVRGHKGTGKTTAVRALAKLLPPIEVIEGCLFQCDPRDEETLHPECRELLRAGVEPDVAEKPTPMVELPLSATEDRLVGTLHIEHALKTGERRFEPGLLASAHRGILYVDEVNLLEDHLVDMLLDAAASGINHVEREGISFSHNSRFILIGTMNPEEGELRPQFLDRFGLCVSIRGLEGYPERREIIRRRLAFERDPQGFFNTWREEEHFFADKIEAARRRLDEVVFPDDLWDAIVRLVTTAGVHGHRADIAIARGAIALAAFVERDRVNPDDIAEAAKLVLPHRLQAAVMTAGPDAGADELDVLITRSLGQSVSYHKKTDDDDTGGQYEQHKELKRDDKAEAAKAGRKAGHHKGPQPHSREYSHEDGEEMQVPGSMAAGSILFEFVKKKMMMKPAK